MSTMQLKRNKMLQCSGSVSSESEDVLMLQIANCKFSFNLTVDSANESIFYEGLPLVSKITEYSG